MQYVKPYTYFVRKPNGATNLLWGSLAFLSTQIIPVLGQVVLLGYRAEVAEDLNADPDLADHRDFDINRFVEYLSRGVWPFLMELLVGAVVTGMAILAMAIGFAAFVATEQEEIGLIVGLVLLVPFTLLGAMLIWPLELHTQLTRGFHFGAAVGFTARFVRRVGGQLFFSLVAHTLISMAIVATGLLFFLIGVFPALMIVFMGQEHYMIQLYRLYLDEGGEPIAGPVEVAEMDEE